MLDNKINEKQNISLLQLFGLSEIDETTMEDWLMIGHVLNDLFEPAMMLIWVDRPNPALDGKCPKDFVRQPGGIHQLAEHLDACGR